MVYMPAEMRGKHWKLARPFHGPYRVLSVIPTNVEVQLVDDPTGDTIFVSLDRVCRCYAEKGNVTWSGWKRKCSRMSPQKGPGPNNVAGGNHSPEPPV